MTSQTDLDQGGTYRVWIKQYMGPSVGWVYGPADSVLAVTTAGSFTITANVSLVTVNINGSVTLTLPPATLSVPAITVPILGNSITVNDIGGFAQTNPITINAPVGSNIMGLTGVTIGVNYGSMTFLPNALGGWDQI